MFSLEIIIESCVTIFNNAGVITILTSLVILIFPRAESHGNVKEQQN